MRKTKFSDKYYTHLDVKKHYRDYDMKVSNPEWVKRHGFYPFIHFKIDMNKYTRDEVGNKYIKEKVRDIYYAAHVDRFIYQYYGNKLNNKYNTYVKLNGINKVAIAYRNCIKGKCNIDFAREVFEFVVKCNKAYIFVGDFSQFFDKLDHKYLKEKLKNVNEENYLDDADFAIYKNITRFSYVEADDIEEIKGKTRREMRNLDKYFDTKEFHEFKSVHLKKNNKSYGIPQGSSISAVYANVYMIDFDKKINDFVTSNKGLYRRYCDDIIIVIPMTEEEKFEKKYIEIEDYVFSIKEKIPNLVLNQDKTEQFFYNCGMVEKLLGTSNLINYLGFTFDGDTVRIRDKSLFKYYCRAYRKVKKVREFNDEKSFNAGRKAIYQSYTHLGAKKYSSYGNFLTYAYKADNIFASSDLLKSGIKNQVKRHWGKIEKKLKQ